MKRSFLLFGVPFIVITFASYILSQKACNYILMAKPDKKLSFNHESHVKEYGAKCEDCHGYYDNGRFKGIPTVGECTGCHDPEAMPLFKQYKETEKPWGSYAKQPDLVYFSHKVVMTAKFEDGRTKMLCTNCHGNKARSTGTEMIKGKMLMSQCEDCHSALRISNSCAVCHD